MTCLITLMLSFVILLHFDLHMATVRMTHFLKSLLAYQYAKERQRMVSAADEGLRVCFQPVIPTVSSAFSAGP
jgi:hypothetical protein